MDILISRLHSLGIKSWGHYLMSLSMALLAMGEATSMMVVDGVLYEPLPGDPSNWDEVSGYFEGGVAGLRDILETARERSSEVRVSALPATPLEHLYVVLRVLNQFFADSGKELIQEFRMVIE